MNCAVEATNASGSSSPGFSNSLSISSGRRRQFEVHGLGHYGLGHYSRTNLVLVLLAISSISVSWSGDFDIIGQVFIAGRLTPAIAFVGDLSVMVGTITGNVAPQVTFGGDLGVIFGLAGGIVPQVTLGALLAFELSLQGNISPVVTPAVNDKFTSGPLWAPIRPCGPVEVERSGGMSWLRLEPRSGELTTTNYGWTKPNVADSDDAWGGMLNADLDGIDSTVHSIQISVPEPSVTTPVMDGAATVEDSDDLTAHADHVHPTNTTRAPVASPSIHRDGDDPRQGVGYRIRHDGVGAGRLVRRRRRLSTGRRRWELARPGPGADHVHPAPTRREPRQAR